MSFVPADQRELFLPLIEGIHETPPWGLFMRNLVARTYARRAFLIINLANAAPDQEPTVLNVLAPRAADEQPLDYRRIAILGLHPHDRMRPQRIYALDELLDYTTPERVREQRAALDAMGIRYGRMLRVSVPGAADAWLALVREREDFSASAVSTLTALAPLLTSALRTLAAIIEVRLQNGMMQDTLSLLGAGQIALDASGRVMAAGGLAEQFLTFSPEPEQSAGRRLLLMPETARALERACTAIADGSVESGQPMLLVRRKAIWLVLRRAKLDLPPPYAAPAVIGTLRLPRRENARVAIRLIAHEYGLSDREAALAHALTLGMSITEAGASLHLTPESARTYSKRVYAKTGTRGQADLVRLLLTGMVPFC